MHDFGCLIRQSASQSEVDFAGATNSEEGSIHEDLQVDRALLFSIRLLITTIPIMIPTAYLLTRALHGLILSVRRTNVIDAALNQPDFY